MKSNHGGVQGKLPAGLTDVGVEQGSNIHRTEAEEEENEQGNNDDMCSEEEDEVNQHYYESKAGVLNPLAAYCPVMYFVQPSHRCSKNFVTLHVEK